MSRPEGSEGKQSVTIYGFEVSLRGDENVQKLIVVIVIQHREHTLKIVELQLISCELYVNFNTNQSKKTQMMILSVVLPKLGLRCPGNILIETFGR